MDLLAAPSAASEYFQDGRLKRGRPPSPWVCTNFIAVSIQFEYDPDELATKIATQLVH